MIFLTATKKHLLSKRMHSGILYTCFITHLLGQMQGDSFTKPE